MALGKLADSSSRDPEAGEQMDMSQTSPALARPDSRPPGLHLSDHPASGACGNVEPGRAQARSSCPESLLGLMGPRGARLLNGQTA